MVLERVETVEDAVVEALLAQFVPDVLDRVEFRGVKIGRASCRERVYSSV